MAMVSSTGTPNNGSQGTTAQNYFMQLLKENQQICVNELTLENAAEAEAEARHRILMDVICTEASVPFRSLEAHAGAGIQVGS